MADTVVASFYLVLFERSNGERDGGIVTIMGDGSTLEYGELKKRLLESAKISFGDGVIEIICAGNPVDNDDDANEKYYGAD